MFSRKTSSYPPQDNHVSVTCYFQQYEAIPWPVTQTILLLEHRKTDNSHYFPNRNIKLQIAELKI